LLIVYLIVVIVKHGFIDTLFAPIHFILFDFSFSGELDFDDDEDLVAGAFLPNGENVNDDLNVNDLDTANVVEVDFEDENDLNVFAGMARLDEEQLCHTLGKQQKSKNLWFRFLKKKKLEQRSLMKLCFGRTAGPSSPTAALSLGPF
jgi:hypothetical protein